MVSINSNSTSETEALMPVVRSVSVVTSTDAGKRRFQLRHQFRDALDDVDGVGARLALDIHNHRRSLVHPRRLLGVLNPVDNVRNILQQHRRAIPVGDDNVPDSLRWSPTDRWRRSDNPVAVRRSCPWPH